MASSRPSAVESAAARPPAATRPDTTYGRPAISGIDSTMMSWLMMNSASCRMPSLLASLMVSRPPTWDQFWTHAGRLAIGWPITFW